MDVREFKIKELKLIIPKRFSDARGYFQETWSDRVYRDALGQVDFVQDNLSLSLRKGTLRGLHFQRPPYAQGKLVRVGRGSIFDVAVDIRKGSPTYGQHVALHRCRRRSTVLGKRLSWFSPRILYARR